MRINAQLALDPEVVVLQSRLTVLMMSSSLVLAASAALLLVSLVRPARLSCCWKVRVLG